MPVDLDWLKALVQLMNQNDLAELSVEDDGRKVRLRKTGAIEARAVPVAAPPAARAGGAGARKSEGAAAGAGPAAAAGSAERAEGVAEILSPMVGTFYRSSSPESDAFVEVGSAVKEDSTLCIIEAMKVMNEIKAEMEGVLQEILVSNGEAVEYGQPLFLVKRSR